MLSSPFSISRFGTEPVSRTVWLAAALLLCGTSALAAAPVKPTALRASESAGTVSLQWQDRSNDEQKFELQRRPQPGSFAFLAFPPANSQSASDSIPSGSVRVYRIRAVNGQGPSGWSNLCWVNANPPKPTKLTVKSRSGAGVALGWNDNSTNESALQVQRRVVGDPGFSLLAKLPADTTAYLDETADDVSSYEYRIRAVGHPSTCIKNSGWSNTARSVIDPPLTYPLTLSSSGSGSGTVVSTPAGISCGTQCFANFAQNASVKLTATASAGSTFAGWSGGCAGITPTCTFTMSGARSVTAAFNGPTCPTAGPLSDLRKDCRTRTYTYLYAGALWENLITDGHTITISQGFGGTPANYVAGTVTSASTFNLTLYGVDPQHMTPSSPYSGSITSGGSFLSISVLGIPFDNAPYYGSSPALLAAPLSSRNTGDADVFDSLDIAFEQARAILAATGD